MRLLYLFLLVANLLCGMKPEDREFLEQFMNMKTIDLNNPEMASLLKVALKCSVLRGHQLWSSKPTKFSSVPFSIPATILRMSRGAIASLVAKLTEQNIALKESINRVKTEIDEEYKIRIEKNQNCKVTLPKGLFADPVEASTNAIYNYCALVHFDKIQETIKDLYLELNNDCAVTIVEKGVKPILIFNYKESLEYKRLNAMFEIEVVQKFGPRI